MTPFITKSPREWDGNVFKAIGQDWMLVTAGREGAFNTMTASWGGLGVLWNTDVSFIFVRPSRYTLEFLEREPYYSLSFFGPEQRKALQFCGAHSGRDTDKMAATGLTPRFDADAPYFDQAKRVFICRKRYFQDIDPKHFLDDAIAGQYTQRDYHRLYVGEIVDMREPTA